MLALEDSLESVTRLVLVRCFHRGSNFSDRLSNCGCVLCGNGLADQFLRAPIADRLQGKALVGRYPVTRRTVRHRNFSIEDFGQARHTHPEVVSAMGNGPERLHRIHRGTLPLLSKRTIVPACGCQQHAQRFTLLRRSSAIFSHPPEADRFPLRTSRMERLQGSRPPALCPSAHWPFAQG